jgi:hypothetical protein
VLFRDARLKIERANKHISDLEARLDGLQNKILVSVERNPHSGSERIKYDLQDRAVADDAAILMGDAVHNLKCALDYTWARTIERTIPTLNEFTKFPVYPKDSLEGALRGKKIDVSCGPLFNLIVSQIKPYDGGNFAIWSVHQIDKGDKHRLLIPIIHYSSADSIEIENEMGERQRGFTMGTTDPFPHFLDFPKGWHVTNEGKPSISIMFKDGDSGSAALRADAAESALCAYLSVIALVGLGISAIWHIWWADPIAALVIVPLIFWEGWEAMRGKACGCC